ncbi:MAG: alkaline phosphatase family protein [Myxococcales bacterium]|nr:alkaline phosphatase family protein [Myxococcales bacterium]
MARGAERRVARVVGLLSLSLASGCTWGVTRGTLTPAELVERVPEGKLTCVAHPPTGPRVRRVLMVGIDGLRPDALEAAATPNLDRLRAAGWYSLEALGEDVSKSGPNWASLFTGVHRARHGVDSNRFLGHRLAQHPDLFARVEAADPGRVTALVGSWPQLHYFGRAADLRVYAPFESCQDRCAEATAVALLSRTNVDVLFVYLQSVDEAGHAHGFGPEVPEYQRAIEAVDGRVGAILGALEGRCSLADEDWLVVVTSDHGGGVVSPREHGDLVPEERVVPFILARMSGEGLAASGHSQVENILRAPPRLVDVLPTVLTHLGLPVRAWAEVDGAPIEVPQARGGTSR